MGRQVRHTIREAADLVGLDRKTIYKHISQGKVSAGISDDGSKFIDTAELMRAYGSLATPGDTSPATPGDTLGDTSTNDLLRELISIVQKQAAELESIRKELEKRPLLEDKTTNPTKPLPIHEDEAKPTPKKTEPKLTVVNGKKFKNPLVAAMQRDLNQNKKTQT